MADTPPHATPEPAPEGMDVRGLTIRAGGATVVEDLRLRLRPGGRLGLIGASGSGKSLTALAMVGLLPEGCTATGSVRLDGRELLGRDEARLRAVRGRGVALVSQHALTALNPLTRVGRQVAEPLRRHQGMSARAAAAAAVRLLDQAGLPDPAAIARSHPVRLSGGQRQRVCVAMALACRPRVLIADEPTTALDTTTQAGVLDLIDRMPGPDPSARPALLLVSHDLAVVARLCDHIAVLHEGHLAEYAPTAELLRHPRHPTTRALLRDARDLGRVG